MEPSFRVQLDPPELPVIHLNGNSVNTLLDQYTAALESVQAARNSLCDIDFHPRDYYVKGPDSFQRARTSRHVSLHHLDQVIQYLESHVEYLVDQSILRSPRNTPRTAQDRANMP